MLIAKGRYRQTRKNLLHFWCFVVALLFYALYGYDPPLTLETFANVLLFQGNTRDVIIGFLGYTSILSEFVIMFWLDRVASFRCPECKRVIDANIDWTCAYCGTEHRNAMWYTILHHCKNFKCRLEPEAFECPHCKKTISLTVETPKKPSEKLVAKKADPSPPPPPKPPKAPPAPPPKPDNRFFLDAEVQKIASLLGHGGHYPKYYWREAQQRVAQASQLLAAHTARWDASIATLKRKARLFCNQHPDFEALLQQILSAEDFSKPKGETSFRIHLDSGYAPEGQFTTIHSPSSASIRQWLRVCYSPEEWTDTIIQGLYAFHQEVFNNPKAAFRVYLSDSERIRFLARVNEFAEANYLLHLHLSIEYTSIASTSVFHPHLLNSPYTLPLKQRLEHQWIIGASGSGKTQLIQRMICDDIENGRSVVVIDSQRDMIQKLLRLKHGMDLLYIDPEDVESPPGIALFDQKFGTGREAEAREAAVIQNYEYMFSVFGSELTGRQGSIFTYALRLMFHVPDSNIHTLISLFRGEDFRKYIGELSQVEREFFEKEFLSPQYKANREQILAKLNIIVSNRTLRRIFANKRKVFDFHEVLSRPCVTLISTSRAQLQTQGCALFGRFMLSLVVDAITQRAHIPEDKRIPTFIYVDEGKDYGNDDAFERIIYECRKYGAGLIFCSQNIGQLSPSTVAALFTSGIKLVRAVKEPAETRRLCQALRVEDAYLHALEVKDRGYAQWVCQVRNKTMTLRADFGYLENRPKVSEPELKTRLIHNNLRYAADPEKEVTLVRIPPIQEKPKVHTPQPKPVKKNVEPALEEKVPVDDNVWD